MALSNALFDMIARVRIFEVMKMVADLQADLEQRVRSFIQDMYDWECFVQDNYDFEMQTGSFEIAVRYMRMVDTYCVPEKRRHGGMSLTDSVHHLPQEEKVVNFKAGKDTATIFTKVTWATGHFIGREEDYEYVFERLDNKWFLDQIYLHAPRGRFECL